MLWQPIKTPLPIDSTVVKSGVSEIAVFANASSPSVVNEAGKLIVSKLSQLANALLPIDVKAAWELSIASSFEHPSKVEFEISSSVSGKSI